MSDWEKAKEAAILGLRSYRKDALGPAFYEAMLGTVFDALKAHGYVVVRESAITDRSAIWENMIHRADKEPE
jgi:hypothetical protein